jgi:hypothetical protein
MAMATVEAVVSSTWAVPIFYFVFGRQRRSQPD